MSVYFIENPDGYVKIGHSGDPVRRLSSLRTARPDLQLLRVVQGGRPVERWLHQRFNRQRVAREWFAFHHDMLTLQPPDEIPVRRSSRLVESRTVAESLREADRLGLLTPAMRAEWAPMLGCAR